MKKIFLILLLSFFELPIFATEQLDLFLKRLEKQDENTKTIQFDFEQEITVSGLTPGQKVSGKFYFQSPDKMRLEENGDERQIIIFNKKKIWMYNPQLRQALESSADTFKSFTGFSGGGIESFNFSNWSKEKISSLRESYDFQITFDSPVVCLTLTPHSSAKDLPANFSLKIYFSEPDLVPQKNILTMETAGQLITTTITIDNFRRDEKLSRDLFLLPPGVEIIRPGKD